MQRKYETGKPKEKRNLLAFFQLLSYETDLIILKTCWQVRACQEEKEEGRFPRANLFSYIHISVSSPRYNSLYYFTFLFSFFFRRRREEGEYSIYHHLLVFFFKKAGKCTFLFGFAVFLFSFFRPQKI